ncbi:MAG: carboxypeptidase-like regulatory domain-containing protein [Bacteroidales bacterium]
MKSMIERFQKYRMIEQLFNENENLFQNNTADQEVRTAYNVKLTEAENRINELLQPLQPFYRVQQESRGHLREQLRLMAGRGMALSRQLEDTQLYNQMHHAYNQARIGGSYALKALSLSVTGWMENHQEALAALGIDAEMLSAFRNETEAFDADLDQTSMTKSQRKASRTQLTKLLSELHDMLRTHFDSFVLMQQSGSPEFVERYQNLRRRKPQYRNRDIVMHPAEIFGMVKDSVTNEPVAGATINLLDHSYVVLTSEDGSFSFDELPAGSYTVSCHAPGYLVPEVITVEAGNNSLLEVNFELQALAATA